MSFVRHVKAYEETATMMIVCRIESVGSEIACSRKVGECAVAAAKGNRCRLERRKELVRTPWRVRWLFRLKRVHEDFASDPATRHLTGLIAEFKVNAS